MNKMDEEVFAIETKTLFKNNSYFNGYQIPPSQKILSRIYNDCVVMTRRDCENNHQYKHLIPYCLMMSTDPSIFVVKRTEKQTEKRLVNLHSVGMGGHVGPIDFMLTKDSIHCGMIRELKEEITGMEYLLDFMVYEPKLIGFINDNSNDVGKVHFGLVYKLLIPSELKSIVKVKETENMIGKWMKYSKALKLKNYESWSKLILGI